MAKNSKKLKLVEIERETYGGAGSRVAINKHSNRTYQDQDGNLYILSRNLSVVPPIYEAYGSFKPNFRGILPRLKVNGKEYWGSGLSWSKAVQMFCAQINAVILSPKKSGK